MSDQTTPDLILIDGSSYFYRAFHALPPLTNSKGQPTGAVYGVLNMIRKLIKDYQPKYLGVVFDAKGKTFRDELYADYKATREKMPDDLSSQFPPLQEIIIAMGLPFISVVGVEADDVIATLAHQASQQNLNVLISTGDKDLAQLVNGNITLINTMSNKLMDHAGVVEKFGVEPSQIIDYLTLIGDKVDNVPGVPKVGPKTAVKWLDQYNSLENIIEHADEFKGKVGENLRSVLNILPLSKKLVTVKDDVELKLTPNDLSPQAADTTKLIEYFRDLEFKSWLSELLNGDDASNEVKADRQYHTILSESEFIKLVDNLKQAEQFVFDTETTSLNAIDAELVGLSFTLQTNEAYYIPVAHNYENVPKQLSRDDVLTALKPIFADHNIKKIGQNLKYDITVLQNYAITVSNIAFDTMLESYILNSSANRHDMDSLALKYLGKKTISYEEVAGKGAKQVTFDKVAIDVASEYAAEDADITWQLHAALWPKVAEDEKLKTVFTDIEMPLVPVLARIEQTGVLIDKDKLQQQSAQLAERIAELQQQAYEIADEEFNLSSPKQLQGILFEKLKLPVLQKTPTGAASTAEAVLHELSFDYPLPKVILEYRSLSKLKSTYTDSLPQQINSKTGRVHTSYNQAVTATGRLSSTDPNLQNIPVRNEEGRRIRQAFIASNGYKILSADYSQVELRIMAHLSHDKSLQDAFAKGLDIHRATAAEVFGVSLDAVTDEQRRKSKAINFGLIYGMSAFGLARQLDVSRDDAQAYIDVYFNRYPGVKQYMDRVRAQAHETGYVETIYGRRLVLPEINARNLQRQRAAERAAINAPMQGTAADIIKRAMLHVDSWLRNSSDVDARMIMQVHDELVFEVADAQIDAVKAKVIDLMQTAADLAVPLIVEAGVGDNWDQAH